MDYLENHSGALERKKMCKQIAPDQALVNILGYISKLIKDNGALHQCRFYVNDQSVLFKANKTTGDGVPQQLGNVVPPLLKIPRIFPEIVVLFVKLTYYTYLTNLCTRWLKGPLCHTFEQEHSQFLPQTSQAEQVLCEVEILTQRKQSDIVTINYPKIGAKDSFRYLEKCSLHAVANTT